MLKNATIVKIRDYAHHRKFLRADHTFPHIHVIQNMYAIWPNELFTKFFNNVQNRLFPKVR